MNLYYEAADKVMELAQSVSDPKVVDMFKMAYSKIYKMGESNKSKLDKSKK
jgi:hypothetical protein